MAHPQDLAITSTTISHDASSSKPFTLYNITVRLPLRSYVVQKRYSDFISLNAALTIAASMQPPVPLPGKSWFTSTVSSPKLTEIRRQELENYMLAIVEDPDKRWRDTSVWRDFLNLTQNEGNFNGKDDLLAATQRGIKAGELTADPTFWLDVHREMKGQLQDARLFLGKRDGATTSQAQHAAGANAKKCLVKAANLIMNLEEGLKIMNEAKSRNEDCTVGAGELRRRKDLLGSAKVERDGLEKLALSLAIKLQSISEPSEVGGIAGPRQNVLFDTGTKRTSGRILGAPVVEAENTQELDNYDILKLQREMMQTQDRDVEELANVVRRQKEMGLAINKELELQNEMLRKVDEGVDRVGKKIDVAKKRANKLR